VDVWTYFAQKEREYADLSLEPEDSFSEMVAEEKGSGGRRGRIFGNLILGGSPVEAFISVSEVVVVHGNNIRREEYGYFLVIEGEEILGYERDLSHDPPVHMHTLGHVRQPAERITFKKFAALAWDEASRRAPRP